MQISEIRVYYLGNTFTMPASESAFLGVLVIVFGVLSGLARFVRAELAAARGLGVEEDRKRPRHVLGYYLLLGSLYFRLVSSDGSPVNKQVLDMVAEPVEITDEVVHQGELSILRAAPSSYKRVEK